MSLRSPYDASGHTDAIAARFWKKVDKSGPHWLWVGYVDRNGYGRFGVNGKARFAHVWSYEDVRGPMPLDLEPDHLCRIRHCVNPWHLEAVTHRENIRRGLVTKLRLTDDEIRAFYRNFYLHEEWTMEAIGRLWGVSDYTVSMQFRRLGLPVRAGAYRALTERQREQVRLVRQSGAKYQDIADHFGVSINTVKRVINPTWH